MSELKRILVVEDSAADAEMTLESLAVNHVANEVILVEDGAMAMDYLRRQGDFIAREPGDPAVILLDLKMPKMDGLEVLQEIRQDEKLRLIPVVMLTSSAEESDLVRSYRLGANAYVVKPMDFNDFAKVVASLGVFWGTINQPPPIPPAR